jgi:hypothetical protein
MVGTEGYDVDMLSRALRVEIYPPLMYGEIGCGKELDQESGSGEGFRWCVHDCAELLIRKHMAVGEA